MKIGIIGLPQTGKKTLFQVLTGVAAGEHTEQGKPVVGVADIQDPRFDTLEAMYKPRKQVRARIDFALLPRLESEAIAQGNVFRDISDVDALCHVVRAFADEAVYHVSGSVDPERDIESVNAELIMHDQIFVEKRLERIQSNLKKAKDPAQQRVQALLEKMRQHLEHEQPLRLMELSPEENLLVRSYPFTTRKQMIIALNVAEDALGDTALLERVAARCRAENVTTMQVSAKVESEVAALESAQERQEFLEELGIGEPALTTLSRLSIEALGLISFFTVGQDEVRQWLVHKGATAPDAAGVIHSDLQRGFIRAEVMRYDELMASGSEAALKTDGKIGVKGRDYIVADGDILNIRFNV